MRETDVRGMRGDNVEAFHPKKTNQFLKRPNGHIVEGGKGPAGSASWLCLLNPLLMTRKGGGRMSAICAGPKHGLWLEHKLYSEKSNT